MALAHLLTSIISKNNLIKVKGLTDNLIVVTS